MATLTELTTKISRRLEDTANAHWSTSEIHDLVNEVRMDLWQMVRRINPSILTLGTKTFTWDADARVIRLDGASYINATDFDMYLVSMTATTEAISATNLPVPLPRIPYEEVNRGGSSLVLQHENQKHYGSLTINGSTPWGYDGVDGGVSMANTWNAGGNASIYAWALQGHDLYVSPVPRTDIQMYIEYITPFATVTSDDQVFGNDDSMFRPWESLIELGAVLAAKGRSDEGTDPIMSQWQYKMDLFMNWLERREITGTPTVIVNGY